MKPVIPHDPRDETLDELIAAALHGELTPEERAQFESRLQTDPAAQAAYQEAQAMHDLLEKTHKEAQPDPAFEQRMVSGVRRKIQTEQHRETAWESVVALWTGTKRSLGGRSLWAYGGICSLMLVCTLLVLIQMGNQVKGVFTTITSQLAMASSAGYDVRVNEQVAQIQQAEMAQARAAKQSESYDTRNAQLDKNEMRLQEELQANPANQNAARALSHVEALKERLAITDALVAAKKDQADRKSTMQLTGSLTGANTFAGATTLSGGTLSSPGSAGAAPSNMPMPDLAPTASPAVVAQAMPQFSVAAPSTPSNAHLAKIMQTEQSWARDKENIVDANSDASAVAAAPAQTAQLTDKPSPAVPAPAVVDGRKLIRNAQLDLEVKSFQAAMDQITTLTKAAGGYVDTSNSQKGGNGKLQGTVVVKVLPQNLDDFLLKLRDLGEVQNQSVSTDDVTKDYFDTQARLANSQRMETQLQDLLKRENGKVSDLLAVERELGRVRGEIEQDQGQLKLYDFQVQYATVTMNMSEKDLNQAAAYLLKEQDDFSLYSTNVEDSFQKTRASAESLKAQVLAANLNHNSGTDVSAELMVMVAPDQVETFLDEIRTFGRVANFTRQTQRVARDGGDSTQPADQTATEKDKVQVHVVIRYDNTTAAYLLKEQDDFSLFATDVEVAFEAARKTADDFKAQVLAANLNHNSGTDVSSELMVMVAPDQIEPFLAQIRSLGRIANFTRQTQRVAQAGSGGDQPADETKTEKDKVQVHLTIRSDDETRKQVALTVVAKAVDDALDQAKVAALAHAGTEILSSSLNKTPQGASTAQLSVRVPGKEYDALIAAFNALGRTASLSIQRNDDSGPGANGDDAPVIVSLSLTDDDTPLQETQLSVSAADVDAQSQQIKKAAAAAGVEVKASSYERQPDGTEMAQMTFRLPMAKYPDFIESVKALGKVESLTIQRDDRPDQTRTDDTAPAEISLQLHNQRDIIADDDGLWATMRHTFSDGAGALFGSIRVIGVLLAFLAPWVFTLVLFAWIGRRIYIWRKK